MGEKRSAMSAGVTGEEPVLREGVCGALFWTVARTISGRCCWWPRGRTVVARLTCPIVVFVEEERGVPGL